MQSHSGVGDNPLNSHSSYTCNTTQPLWYVVSLDWWESSLKQPTMQRKSLSKEPYSAKYSFWRSIIMGNKNIVARSNIKQPSPRKTPTKTVFTTQSHSNGIQQSGEWGEYVHLPIVSHSEKINIPLMGGIRKLQMVFHCSILLNGNAKQVWKSCLET